MAENAPQTLARLRTIAGHLHAAAGLIEAGRTLDAVAQLLAIRAALRAVMSQIGRRHVERCLGIQPDDRMVHGVLAWLRAEMVHRRRRRAFNLVTEN